MPEQLKFRVAKVVFLLEKSADIWYTVLCRKLERR